MFKFFLFFVEERNEWEKMKHSGKSRICNGRLSSVLGCDCVIGEKRSPLCVILQTYSKPVVRQLSSKHFFLWLFIAGQIRSLTLAQVCFYVLFYNIFDAKIWCKDEGTTEVFQSNWWFIVEFSHSLSPSLCLWLTPLKGEVDLFTLFMVDCKDKCVLSQLSNRR